MAGYIAFMFWLGGMIPAWEYYRRRGKSRIYCFFEGFVWPFEVGFFLASYVFDNGYASDEREE